MPLVQYEIVSNTPELLIIRDQCNLNPRAMSVTNSAETVVEELFKSGILKSGQRLKYYDSENCLDELLHRDGVFVGFKVG